MLSMHRTGTVVGTVKRNELRRTGNPPKRIVGLVTRDVGRGLVGRPVTG